MRRRVSVLLLVVSAAFLCGCGRTLNIGEKGGKPGSVDDGKLDISLSCETVSQWEEGRSAGIVMLDMLEGDRDEECEIVCRVDGEVFVEESVLFSSYIGGISRKLPAVGPGTHKVTLAASQKGCSCTAEASFEQVKPRRPVGAVVLSVGDTANGHVFECSAKDGDGIAVTGLEAMAGDGLSFGVKFTPADAEWTDLKMRVRDGKSVGGLKDIDGKSWSASAVQAGETVLSFTYVDCGGPHEVTLTVPVRGTITFSLSYDADRGGITVTPHSGGADSASYGWDAEYVIHAVSYVKSSVTDYPGTPHYRDFVESSDGSREVSAGTFLMLDIKDITDEVLRSYEVSQYTHMGRTQEMRFPYTFESIDCNIEFLADKKWYDCICEPWESMPYEEYTEWTITINDIR